MVGLRVHGGPDFEFRLHRLGDQGPTHFMSLEASKPLQNGGKSPCVYLG